MVKKTITDTVLEQIYSDLNIRTDKEKSDNIYQILDELSMLKSTKKLNVSVWGKITERLVETFLKLYAKDTYFNIIKRNDEWVGDFGLFGVPFNTIISVKSYSSKERALTSGSGSALCPTILYGHFLKENYKDYDRPERLQSYKIRGFTSVYMPNYTYDCLCTEAKEFKNINQNKFVRKIENFGPDIKSSIEIRQIGGFERLIINPLKL